MELLSSLSFAKAMPLSNENAILVDEIEEEAVADLKLVRPSELKARPAKKLINEL